MVLNLFRHLRPGKLKCHIYHGQNRKGTEYLEQYDVVITTYHTVSAIWRKLYGQLGNEKSIFSLTWHRVILDEGEVSHRICLCATNLNSSYYPEPAEPTSPGLLHSPFNEAMGDHRDSDPKQARRFRQHCQILASLPLFRPEDFRRRNLQTVAE